MQHPIRLLCHFGGVGCHKERFASVAGQFEQQFEHRCASVVIQVAGWLVGEDEQGIVRE